MLRGAYDILDTVCKDLGGIKPGETTKDGKFTVIEVECQGACSNAPMMVVGDDFYVRLRRVSQLSTLLTICTHAGGLDTGDNREGLGCVQEG